MQLSEHFTLPELTRSQTAARLGIDNRPEQAGDEIVLRLQDLCLHILEPVRGAFRTPFAPSSGYRSPALNRAIGGSSSSQHMLGQAVDLELPGVANAELALWMSENLDFDQLILECYRPGQPDSGWVHCSFVIGCNRQQVLTFTGQNWLQGLVT